MHFDNYNSLQLFMIVYVRPNYILRPNRQWIDFFCNLQQSTVILWKTLSPYEELEVSLKGGVYVSVCVCVCVWERERERDTGGVGARQRGLEVLFWFYLTYEAITTPNSQNKFAQNHLSNKFCQLNWHLKKAIMITTLMESWGRACKKRGVKGEQEAAR